MSIFTTLSNLFSGRNFSNLDANQEKALVDALAFAMAIDHHVDPTEEDELTDALRVLKWRSNVSLAEYVRSAIERAEQKADEQAEAAAYCGELAERLGEDWLREEAYYFAARIAAADAEIVDQEQALLAIMVDAFDIDHATQERITNQLLRETDF
jgi:hypothetical protein